MSVPNWASMPLRIVIALSGGEDIEMESNKDEKPVHLFYTDHDGHVLFTSSLCNKGRLLFTRKFSRVI